MKSSLMGGSNRTGMALASEMGPRMMEATAEFPPSSGGGPEGVARTRAEYARAAEPIGTMPPPASMTQAARTVAKGVMGGHPMVFLDKLGERLAFERTGVRLYDALLSKHDAGRTFRGGPGRQDLAHIRDEEHRHMLLVADAIRELGGDPTVVSPSANVQAVASMGIPKVLSDPRTDVQQCLEAILVAELADNECWTALIELAENAGNDSMVAQFHEALEREREHLARVRAWVATATGRSGERAAKTGRSAATPSGRAAPSGGKPSARSRVKPQRRVMSHGRKGAAAKARKSARRASR